MTYFSRGVVALTAIVVFSGVQGATVQYSITFDGSNIGPSGTGSFIWDTTANQMTTFIWDFGGGNVGSIPDTLLDTASFGATVGANLFEVITGQDVALGVSSATNFGVSGVFGLIGPFPGNQVGFSGSDNPSTPSEYLMRDDVSIVARGLYSASVALPEPGTLGLLLIGVAGSLFVRRRRRAA